MKLAKIYSITAYLKSKSINNLINPFSIYHLIFYVIYSKRKNYEFGGFKKYKFGVFKFLIKDISIFGKKSTDYFDADNNLNIDYKNELKFVLLRNPLSKFRVITLFPNSFARSVSEKKPPQLLNLVESSKSQSIYLYDYESNIISDSSKFNDRILMKAEWNNISNVISKYNITVLIILGHKNSFCEQNGRELLELKEKYGITTLLYLTDNWNLVYEDLIIKWSSFVDFIISYDYTIINRFPDYLNKKIIVWPNCPPQIPRELNTKKNVKFSLYFTGTCYLNRWGWSVLISCWHKLHRSKLELIYDYQIQPIAGESSNHKNVSDYRKNYRSYYFAAFYFLERHPGIYSLISSVWDGFAAGSLVIVQTSENNDPLAKFFIPNKHYLAFSDLTELVKILQFLEENPELAQTIANNGYDYYRDNYNPRVLWTSLATKIEKNIS